MEKKISEDDLKEFDWIQLRKDIGNTHPSETQKEKLIRKFSENPVVPIGCLATTVALVYGLWSFQKGNQEMSQKMMRSRVGAQAFTVVALIGGVLFGTTSFTRN